MDPPLPAPQKDEKIAEQHEPDPFAEHRAIIKGMSFINLAWFIEIEKRFWTPGEMTRLDSDQQAYYISVLHSFPNITHNIPPVPDDFFPSIGRDLVACDVNVERWLFFRQANSKTRGIETLQAMIPLIWAQMEGPNDPSLVEAELFVRLSLDLVSVPKAEATPQVRISPLIF